MSSPTKQIQDHYDRLIQGYELYNRERTFNLREGLNKIIEGMKTDEIICAMKEDPLSSNYAYHRMKEIVDNNLIAESE